MKSPYILRNAVLGLALVLASCSSGWKIARNQFGSVDVKGQEGDRRTEAFIQPYRTGMNQQMEVVIGNAAADLEIGRPQGKLGNYAADLLFRRCNSIPGQSVQASVINNGGLRNPIRAGQITAGNLYELMPFDNEVVIVRMRGATLDSLVNYFVWLIANKEDIKATFPMSNVKIHMKHDHLVEWTLNGNPVDPHGEYAVATTDYLAGGGDNLSFFRNAIEIIPTGLQLRDVLMEDIRNTPQGISAEVDDRFIIEF